MVDRNDDGPGCECGTGSESVFEAVSETKASEVGWGGADILEFNVLVIARAARHGRLIHHLSDAKIAQQRGMTGRQHRLIRYAGTGRRESNNCSNTIQHASARL